MANTQLNTRIKQRIDTTANWTTNSSTILADGEIGFERTTSGEIKFKVGDGQKTWAQLSYVANSSASSGSGTSNADEIYVGATEPTGYKMWIDPTADASGSLESIPISYIDFTLTTVNDEEVLTTEYDFDDVETEVEAESVVIARITTDDSILYAQLLERKDIGETPLDTFLFGVATNDSYKIFTINENDICAVSTMSLGGGGTSFEVGNHLKLENNVLDTKYGDFETGFGTVFSWDTSTALPDGIDSDDEPEFIEGPNQLLLSFYIDATQSPLPLPAITSGKVELRIDYTDGTYKTVDTRCTLTESDDDTDGNITDISSTFGVETPVYFAGSLNAAQPFALQMQEKEDGMADLITAWAQEENLNKLSYLWIDVTTVMNFPIAINALAFPASMRTSENGADPLIITLNGNTIMPHKISSDAINLGNALRNNNGKIDLNYGQKIKDYFYPQGTVYESATSPNDYIFGSLYGWSVGSNITPWEPNTNPSSYYNSFQLKYYSGGEDRGIRSWDYRNHTHQSTIDYTEDTYYTIPLYYATQEDFKNCNLEDALIELKEMPYTNNILYTAAASALDTNNPDYNVFYAGTYNTSDDVNTIITNGTITPDDNEKPAILFIVLDKYYNNKFFWIYSNKNDLQLGDKNDDEYQICQGNVFAINKSMPFSLFNRANKLSTDPDDQQLVIGFYNDVSNLNRCLIVNDYSSDYSSDTKFCAGYGSRKQLYVHGDNVDINSSYISINGSLTINGNQFLNRGKINYMSPIQSISDTANATTKDIAEAYNTLASQFNSLLSYLQSNNYMYNNQGQ